MAIGKLQPFLPPETLNLLVVHFPARNTSNSQIFIGGIINDFIREIDELFFQYTGNSSREEKLYYRNNVKSSYNREELNC